MYQVLIVGGGIHGVGIAADAALRGLSVFLCEQADFAQHTSSASSKLIHGGLRYLEHGAWRLVREALQERETLMSIAPHLVHPLRFVMPHNDQLRPAWMIRSGLFLYDRLARRDKLPASGSDYLSTHQPLDDRFKKAFYYYDCQTNDARLTLSVAQLANDSGATLRPRTRCIDAKREEDYWVVRLQPEHGAAYDVRAKTLINAAGPWVQALQHLSNSVPTNVRWVQGSHIVLEQPFPMTEAYLLQNDDRRVVFVLPWQQRYCLVGTTDHNLSEPPAQARPTLPEVQYLLDTYNRHFKLPIHQSKVLHAFAGVRTLHDAVSDNASSLTRDYSLPVDAPKEQAPLLTIVGGKLTTYRRLAEKAINRLQPWLGNLSPSLTASTILPGGQSIPDWEAFVEECVQRYPALPSTLVKRLTQYGQKIHIILHNCSVIEDLGQHFGDGLYAREVDYLIYQEWAVTAEDILWRRTQLGLKRNSATEAALTAYLQEKTPLP